MVAPVESRLRVVFAGTPDFAVPALRALKNHSAVDVAAVYTQPDRPAGRGRHPQASAVKRFAKDWLFAVEQPERFGVAAVTDRLRALAPDLLVVAAYGLILPKDVISIPRYGSINVHASILPRWRGAAPIQRAIMAGDTTTGITIMRVIEALDAGPIWLQKQCEILPTDTAGDLDDRLALIGEQCLSQAIDLLLSGKVVEQPQIESGTTYATKIMPHDRKLNWRESASLIARRVRALNPMAVATAEIAALPIKIWAAEALEMQSDHPPGTVLAGKDTGIDIATGDGVLRITQLQPPGKRRMSAGDFMNGYGSALR